MISRRVSVFLTIICLITIVSSADEPPQSASVSKSAATYRDIVFFHLDHPIFIRVRPEVDGLPFEQPWLEYVGSLFAEIDADGNGRWTSEEVAGLLNSADTPPSSDALRLARDPDLWSADRNAFDQTITMDELTAFLIGTERGPFQAPVTETAATNSSAVGATLFGLLDGDTNGTISANEFMAAMASLHRRDLDDDETFGVEELTALANPYAAQPTPAATADRPPFIALTPGVASLSVLKEFERRYSVTKSAGSGGGRNTMARPMDRRDLGFEPAVFDQYDVDRDGELDRDELRELIRRPPPTVELVIRLGARGEEEFVVERVDSTGRQDIDLRRSADGLMCLAVTDVQIELAVVASGPDVARRYLLKQFTAADSDQNNYIDTEEAERSRAFRSSFDQFDEDGDGKLFEVELTAVIDRRMRAARSQTRMDVRSGGRDLFEILDVDRNRRLGRREFAQVVRRIELWDADGDGSVSQSEIPHVYQLSFGPGQPQFPGVQFPGQETGRAGEDSSAVSMRPLWFRKLDRNNDGELTRREFPGTLTEFQTFDKNSDGVLDAEEAESVK